ncbi:TcpQ domain-containing protein [Cedecea sp. P7760]|uniref:TcpQ domain-containing protein n=1 Tax=Cedecea sp. P7760 TaxID=2726983 RepID=UPI00159FF138|nr:TcpQ domain-containing protein [Cedecea sp. P7760]NWC64014.1 TcpQ domain-containing protein [Cedecea sp. P7760]
MSFTERAGLIPVLLLTGCAQQTVYTGPPSGSVVDSMLTRSAADISAMQYRVHQTGPSAQRPVSPVAKPVKPLAPGIPGASALTVKPVSSPTASAPGTGPADGFIRQAGAAPTLREALQKIVPSGQTVVFDKAVFADTPELWRWTGNDRWQYVTDKMLAARGLKATVNEKTHTVKVEPAQLAQTAHSAIAVSPPVPPGGPTKAAVAVKASPLPTTGRNPFRGNQAVPAAVSQTSAPVRAVLKPQPAVRIWTIERGTTLRQGYEQWVSQEACASDKPKWTVRWDTGTNYPIDYTLTFHAASFEDATAQLFNLWHRAQVPLFVSGYRQQCLVVISDVPPNPSTPPSRQE